MKMITRQQGQSIQIIKFNDGKLILDEPKLSSILMNDSIKNMPVCVIGVAGELRAGKSFLLSIMLRYLRAQSEVNWLKETVELERFFDWGGGDDRKTLGIMMWSEPFVVTSDTGENVAVFLVDSEGAFELGESMKVANAVFALTTLISSVIIYNLETRLKEVHVKHLKDFILAGSGIQELHSKPGTAHADMLETHSHMPAPFQKLTFLIRNWESDQLYGLEGGKKTMEKLYKVNENQLQDQKDTRTVLRQCFQNVDCFRIPHPKTNIKLESYTGKLSESWYFQKEDMSNNNYNIIYC